MPEDGSTSGGAGLAFRASRSFCARISDVNVSRARPAVLLGTLLFVGLAFPASAEIDAATRAKAVRVEALIEKIKQETERAENPLGRKESVAEDELNAYITCRLYDDQEPIMKELRLKLLRNNRFEGMTVLDFSGAKLPGLLRGRLDAYFAGRLEAAPSAVRLAIEDLFINGQRVRPEILDVIISIGSRLAGTEAFSLRSWYGLPYGIKNLTVEAGRLLAFYAP